MLSLHSRPTVKLSAVSNSAEILSIQRQLDEVFCTDELKGYIIDLVRQSRLHGDLMLGASPRAAINLMKAGRAHALLQGRSFLTHEDVQSIALPVLGHRLIIKPESEMDGKTVGQVVQQLIQSVPVLKNPSRDAAS